MVSGQSGVGKFYRERVVAFTAGDGMQLNIINVRGQSEPSKCPVLLVHGAGVRANIFRAPVETNIVDALIADGYDVWLENWRASIDFAANPWTLDQAAVYDHPYAVKTVLAETGAKTLKAIIHCQGSTSFTMSAMAGLIPEVTTIVTNAVSLHTVVPLWSRFKLNVFVPLVNQFLTQYLNPHWGVNAPTFAAKFIDFWVHLTHHECHNEVCKQVSFTYGSGFPALWSHVNLTEETHEWIKEEFNAVPLRFFKQMARCVKRGSLVSVEGFEQLPLDFADNGPKTEARFAFFAGINNLCFLADSQARSYQYFCKQRKNFHSLHLLPSYGHLDVFLGKHAAQETYPLIIAELNKD